MVITPWGKDNIQTFQGLLYIGSELMLIQRPEMLSWSHVSIRAPGILAKDPTYSGFIVSTDPSGDLCN